MKKALLLVFCFVYIPFHVYSKNEIDSILRVLDKAISDRPAFTLEKEVTIKDLKSKLKSVTLEEEYLINDNIITEYESFICDSTIAYINRNIEIAEQLNNKEWLYKSKIQYSFVLSLSGLFTQALEVIGPIKIDELPNYLKLMYCWTYIRYYENLLKYTDDPKYGGKYLEKKKLYRDTIISYLNKDSEMYIKEMAFKQQDEGKYEDACRTFIDIFNKQEPYTHHYAMSAMSLANIYKSMGNKPLEEKYLILAAITDTRSAVKENEALLALAMLLYEKGDVNRAYTYIKAALDDANFYNSRFRNTVIARVQPIVEETYLKKIEHQQKNLRGYAVLSSLFVVILIISLYYIYKQIKIVSRAKKNLKIINEQLTSVNQKLDEANLIKEKYIGYFMNQCAVYIDKLDDYRKNVNRKIKAGQIDDLYNLTSSTRGLEKDVEELYETFDKAFFNIYPNFVEEFNHLLRESERYKPGKGRLNTELRIFALIRLGIIDVNQIAIFLRYSMQTIYNYKSKVRSKALESDSFEEDVKKIGGFS